MLPYIIDDLDLSLSAFRLYVHLKRVAGENGVCYQKQGLLEKNCHMTGKSIVKAKRELEAFNLITIDRIKDKHKVMHRITINDIWNENTKKYQSLKRHKNNIMSGVL